MKKNICFLLSIGCLSSPSYAAVTIYKENLGGLSLLKTWVGTQLPAREETYYNEDGSSYSRYYEMKKVLGPDLPAYHIPLEFNNNFGKDGERYLYSKVEIDSFTAGTASVSVDIGYGTNYLIKTGVNAKIITPNYYTSSITIYNYTDDRYDRLGQGAACSTNGDSSCFNSDSGGNQNYKMRSSGSVDLKSTSASLQFSLYGDQELHIDPSYVKGGITTGSALIVWGITDISILHYYTDSPASPNSNDIKNATIDIGVESTINRGILNFSKLGDQFVPIINNSVDSKGNIEVRSSQSSLDDNGMLRATYKEAELQNVNFSYFGETTEFWELELVGGGGSEDFTLQFLINYDDSQVSIENENKLDIFHFNENEEIWEALTGRVDTKNNTITFETNSFSKFALGYSDNISNVPVPAAFWLFSSGLIGLLRIGSTRR